MVIFKHTPVDSYLIHKEHDDDVLISNFRCELPTRLPASCLHAEDLSAEVRGLLVMHYAPIDGDVGLCCSTEGLLLRRSVPRTLPKSAAAEDGFSFIRDYYKEASGQFIFQARYLPEEHDVALMNRFVPEECQISAYERYRLSEVVDCMPNNERLS